MCFTSPLQPFSYSIPFVVPSGSLAVPLLGTAAAAALLLAPSWLLLPLEASRLFSALVG